MANVASDASPPTGRRGCGLPEFSVRILELAREHGWISVAEAVAATEAGRGVWYRLA